MFGVTQAAQESFAQLGYFHRTVDASLKPIPSPLIQLTQVIALTIFSYSLPLSLKTSPQLDLKLIGLGLLSQLSLKSYQTLKALTQLATDPQAIEALKQERDAKKENNFWKTDCVDEDIEKEAIKKLKETDQLSKPSQEPNSPPRVLRSPMISELTTKDRENTRELKVKNQQFHQETMSGLRNILLALNLLINLSFTYHRISLFSFGYFICRSLSPSVLVDYLLQSERVKKWIKEIQMLQLMEAKK